MQKLGVNIDHIATLRQLRGTPYPDLIRAAQIVENAGGDQITVHLREDRRHINDKDVKNLRAAMHVSLNLEMAATLEMAKIAKRIGPDWVCLVPEKRQELTTEGGLDLKRNMIRIRQVIALLKKEKIKVSTFIEPSVSDVKMSAQLGVDAVELHTGRYCLESQKPRPNASTVKREINRIYTASVLAKNLGLGVHAGHGFDYENVRPIAALVGPAKAPLLEEFNIGHSIVCRAVIVGLDQAVREMISSIRAP